MATPPTNSNSLDGHEVVLCVCGGIAAYKSAALASRLVQAGCGVTVALTRNGRRFVTPVTFQALTARPVLTSLWSPSPHRGIPHLDPTEQADLVVVAPATANIIGKLAGGIADDLVSTLLLGAACPVLLAPAMNVRMWQHPAVQRNVARLKQDGVTLVGPAEGWLACGAVGAGRMVEPEELLSTVHELLRRQPPRAAAKHPAQM